MKTIGLILIFQIVFINIYSINNDTIYITDVPSNISFINSSYDDYNTCISLRAYPIERLIFSTNRFSKGKNFDLTSYILKLTPHDKKYHSSETSAFFEKDTLLDLSQVNTNCNELGPYIIKFDPHHYWNDKMDSGLFFISRQCDKDLDIYYSKYEFNNFHIGAYKQIDNFKPLSIINTKYDEGYVSISDNYKELYYCSNQFGNFDIYELSDSLGTLIDEIIYKNSPFQIKSLKNINSNYDDKCPLVFGNDYMVFSSNRPGGYGGYDLYYSIKKDNVWSEPVNFGAKINSKYDEYRPFIFEGTYMIFSSNRPNGKGGFDLYIVEVK